MYIVILLLIIEDIIINIINVIYMKCIYIYIYIYIFIYIYIYIYIHVYIYLTPNKIYLT